MSAGRVPDSLRPATGRDGFRWVGGFRAMFRTNGRGIEARFGEGEWILRLALVAMLMIGSRSAAGESPKGPARTSGASDGAAEPRTEAEVSALRAEVAGRLQAIGAPATSQAQPGGTGAGVTATVALPKTAEAAGSSVDAKIRELLQERLKLLEEYGKELAAFEKASHPEPSPEKQADEARTEWARLQALLSQAGAHPEVLLPQAFRDSGKPAVSVEMKEAIQAAASDRKESQAKLEAIRAEAAEVEVRQNAHRAERDKLFQAVAAMKARGSERTESAAESAPAPGSASPTATAALQKLAHERKENADWKARLSAARLRAVEAQIALETRMAGVREWMIQVAQAQEQVASRTLALLQSRYSDAAEQQERALKARAAAEEKAALRADNPLERYRARRRAELLDLEAQVVKHEQALATSPSPSLPEQLALADRAGHDFERVKQLLDDGRVSRLDAIRLNNDFRRIGPERDQLMRKEMAIAEARLQFYEDSLTSVEIELLQDSLHDRFELELLKESLPPSRWAEGQGLLDDLERDHRGLLDRHRKVLERLCDETERTLDQVARRLAILDEEYAFIRTHIFWVRDREPIGASTLRQAMREAKHLARALVRLAREATATRSWGRSSPEFFAAAIAAIGLPIGLIRVRRLVRARLAREMGVQENSIR